MSDEQETKLPEAVGEAKEEPSKEASPPEEADEGGGDKPKKKEEEAVEAAESTATFEPVVSAIVLHVPIPGVLGGGRGRPRFLSR